MAYPDGISPMIFQGSLSHGISGVFGVINLVICILAAIPKAGVRNSPWTVVMLVDV